jgi:hypothetical protein
MMTQIILRKYQTIILILAGYFQVMPKPTPIETRYSLLFQSDIIRIIQTVLFI